jgi:hypothetical protein
MQLVIDSNDFQRLSTETRQELLGMFAGQRLEPARVKKSRYRWRQPTDLAPDQVLQLLHGLSEEHRKRLKAFAASADGRVRMQDLLAANGDSDWHTLSYFQSVVTRKLRRVLGDGSKAAHLIGWDYDSTKWNEDHTTIVDGVYYVSPVTAESLRQQLQAH